MSPDPDMKESVPTTVAQRRNEANDGIDKSCFVCPKCKQRRKSRKATSQKTETDVRTSTSSKSGSKICKKCRKTLTKSTATTTAASTTSAERPRRSSSCVTSFHPRWTHYGFLLGIYLVFSVILYYMTLRQED
jgi:hypothetical protein